jgi:hypothetical protein
MPSRASRQRVARLGAGLTSIGLVLAAVGLVYAGSGSPSTIGVTRNGLTVSASGTWSWPEMDTNPKLSYTGFAVSWGDVTRGNTLGAYHLGDGTAATNFVTEIPTQGDKGPWGPVDHTYATPGAYTICVIIYDLGEVKPFKPVGYHSLKASGTSRNSDNSVDKQTAPPVVCSTVEVVGETASPSATEAPTASPAPTESPTPVTTVTVANGVQGRTTTSAPSSVGDAAGPTAAATPIAAGAPVELFQGETAVPISALSYDGAGPGSPGSNGGAPGGGALLSVPLLLLLVAVSTLGAIALASVRASRR